MREEHVVHCSFRGGDPPKRTVRISVGRRYVVAPMNPRKKKYRGMTGELVSTEDEFMPSRAKLKCDHDGRSRFVDTHDLVELDP